MKNKYKIISKTEAKKWYEISNMFAKSLFPFSEAIKEYNKLSSKNRNEIKRSFDEYDEIRRKKIPKGEADTAWFTCVMVDAHIIATEADVNPLTAIMCINSPLNNNFNVLIK